MLSEEEKKERHKIAQKKYYEKNKERFAEYNRQYYQDNKEKLDAKKRTDENIS